MYGIQRSSKYSSNQSLENENENKLKRALIQIGLKEKNVNFIIERGEDFTDHPEILMKKLKIKFDQAKQALDILKLHRKKDIPIEVIKQFEHLVNRHPNDSLLEIALLKGFNNDVVSAYLECTESIPMTDIQKGKIKEKIDVGNPIHEIANQLRISQNKVREYVEVNFITFSGAEGQKIFETITRNFGECSIVKLRERILARDVKLQEQLYFQLENIEHRVVRQYFIKFEESQSFFEFNKELTIEARQCIRTASYHDIEKLSHELNRLQNVIRDYLLQYYPDDLLMHCCSEGQLKQIKNLIKKFGMSENISHKIYRMVISVSFDHLFKSLKTNKDDSNILIMEILPLVFFYLKCSLPLEELAQIISNITDIALTALDLFHLIFQMSDPIVRGLCIEHYSFSNPVPLYYPTLGSSNIEQTFCQFEVCKELWYSVQQFNGLVSFGLGWASWNPIGKSRLLDSMFETDFEKGSPQNSAFHLGSIDIQMTKNLYGNKEKNNNEHTQWAYIDCHGYSEYSIITKICRNLDIVIIHVTYFDYENKDKYPHFYQDFKIMTENTKHVYLFIRDHPGSNIEKKEVLINEKPQTIFLIPNLKEQKKSLCTEFKEIGYEILHNQTQNIKLVNSFFVQDLMTDFGERTRIEEENSLIMRIIEQLSINKMVKIKRLENTNDFRSLAYYPHYIKYMQSYYKTATETEQKVIDDLNENCRILDEKINKVKMSEIVLNFNEIIYQENSTLVLWKLAQELNIHARKYTLEILWREALLSFKYSSSSEEEANDFSEHFASNFSNYVERGEPFELIDGDNLRFFNQDIDALLSDFHDNQSHIIGKNKNLKNRPPIVISIFGPQSSGKSTLLNYCFGCKFLTSAGRCTKGVYASLSKLSKPINNSDHFLILDTEGLDSIEKGKVLKETSCIHFDRTMVLFCLAVSQIVIINVRGDIGEEMRNILQICAYSLTKLKVSKVPAPKIFFVLNQQADPDPQKHLSSINTLLEHLNEDSNSIETEGLTISDLIHISRENLFVLPSAFNSLSINTQIAKLFDSDLNKLSPTVSFANKCADLRMSIIQQLRRDKTPINKAPFATISEWMEMSGVIWDTIVKYQDIVKYRNVDELRCSILLSKIVSDLLKKHIYFHEEEYQLITDTIIKNNITSCKSPLKSIEEIKVELDEIFRSYQEDALKEFSKKCQTDLLLKKMNYLCDDAKSNLCRLIYMEKKIYEDKLRLDHKARETEIRISENMLKFQEAIEKNADQYLELNIEEQKGKFDLVWLNCFGSENVDKEETERNEMFENLYSVFRIESKTMENKSTIFSLFRESNFDMEIVLQNMRSEIITKFCDDPNTFAGAGQYIFPWKENKVPIKDMTPYIGKGKCEYLSRESLWASVGGTIRRQRKKHLKYHDWVPSSCYSLIEYCSGYYNHPDIVWKLQKRKQILLLASKLRDPDILERSTWEKFIDDISRGVTKITQQDQNISHSTVKEIVNLLVHICRVLNYEINYIEAKLTNTAERSLSTYAFALAFKSLLESKTEKQRKNKIKLNTKKEKNLDYFLQKVDNRKIARGNWDRKEMRKGDKTIANKFASDLLEALWRSVDTKCKQIINEDYFSEKRDSLSHKSLLLLANQIIQEDLDRDHEIAPIPEDNFVVQFICNHSQNQKRLFQDEWLKVSNELYDRIVEDMRESFTKEVINIKIVLTEFLSPIVEQCEKLDRPDGIGLDSDSNFIVASQLTEESEEPKPDYEMSKTKEFPFKAMVLFLEMYLNPNVNPEEFKLFFNNTFEVDGVPMQKNQETYVLCDNYDPEQTLNTELFEKLTETQMFRNTETIFNIKEYIDEFLHTLMSYEFQVTQTDYEKLLKSTKEQYESRVINCPYQCPSCGKFCEREIHPHEGKCQIMTGHQVCSMGGKVWNTDEDRTAILLMCDDYDDDTQVLIPGEQMKWWEFKDKCGDQWEWDLPKDDKFTILQKENREKMENIWNKFGKKILEYYTKKGIHISYIPYSSPEEICESLLSKRFYVCFVVDGTELMGSAIELVKRWVKNIMDDLEEEAYFKLFVYHGHYYTRKDIEKFPNNSEFTSNKVSIQSYLETIETYSTNKTDEFAMLHGLATAIAESEWKTGLHVNNTLLHIYVEPTRGFFDIFEAKQKCVYGCPFVWQRDIRNKMVHLQINYEKNVLVRRSHPLFVGNRRFNVNDTSINLNSEEECKPKAKIFINYKPDI